MRIALLVLAVAALAAAAVDWRRVAALRTAPAARAAFTVIRPPRDVNALAIAGAMLYAGGMDGVTAVEAATGRVRATWAFEHVRALLARPGGGVWVGHAGGISRLADGRREDDTQIRERVNALYGDRSGRVWAGTWKGAAFLEPGGSWRRLTARDGLAEDMVNTILEDRAGRMWFGSYVAPRGGISVRHSDGRWQRIGPKQGLPHANVTSLVEDAGGAIWCGTGLLDRGGLARIVCREQCRVAEVLHASDGLAGEKVRSLYFDRAGRLWAGSEYDGLAVQTPSGWRIFLGFHGLSHPEIKAMLEDPPGGLWLATRDGVTHVDVRRLPL